MYASTTWNSFTRTREIVIVLQFTAEYMNFLLLILPIILPSHVSMRSQRFESTNFYYFSTWPYASSILQGYPWGSKITKREMLDVSWFWLICMHEFSWRVTMPEVISPFKSESYISIGDDNRTRKISNSLFFLTSRRKLDFRSPER